MSNTTLLKDLYRTHANTASKLIDRAKATPCEATRDKLLTQAAAEQGQAVILAFRIAMRETRRPITL